MSLLFGRRGLQACFSNIRQASSSTCRPEPVEADSLMDIGLRNIYTEEHDMLRTTARKFAREVLQPNELRWSEQGYPDREVFKEMGRLGLHGIDCPVEDHGQGGDFIMASLVTEEMCYVNSALPASLSGHNDVTLPYLRDFGSREQKDRYLPGVISGEKILSIAMTEPGTGSDLQGIQTHAKRDGDDWILNGSKTFITNGYNCDVAVVVARTPSEGKSAAHGLTLFIVEKDMPGFSKSKPLKKMGLHASDTAQLFFDDVRVPAENVLGGVNQAFYCMMKELPFERLGTGSMALAYSEFMFEYTREYVMERKAFGKRLADLQTIQHNLAEMKTMICSARAFLDQNMVASVNGRLNPYMASMAKLNGTEVANQVGQRCIQLHGGMGYMYECDVARAAVNVRAAAIYAGANEIMKEMIGKMIVSKK